MIELENKNDAVLFGTVLDELYVYNGLVIQSGYARNPLRLLFNHSSAEFDLNFFGNH